MQEAVGGLILRRNQILLVLRRKEPEAGCWSIPGGLVEWGETPEAALRREIREELDADCAIRQYLGAFSYNAADGRDVLSLLFHVELRSGIANSEPSIHANIQWFDPADLPSNLAQPARFALSKMNSVLADEDRQHRRCVKSADVLLVQPFFPLADKESLSLPLGLASIHSVLKSEGFQVETLDCNVPSDYAAFCNDLQTVSPTIVGVQFHSDMSFEWADRTCIALRKSLRAAKIVAGGELATHRFADLLNRGSVDVVVREEGERTFGELVKCLAHNDQIESVSGICYRDSSGTIRSTGNRDVIRNLDELPFQAIQDLSWREYGQWTLFTSRGCPFRCFYCSSAAYWKHSIRYQSATRVLQDVARLVEEFHATDVYIADDTFTLDKARVLKICKMLIDSRVDFRWSCLTRVDCIDVNLASQMRKAGCVLVSFGVETANDFTLKGIKKSSTHSETVAALRTCRKAGIRTRVSLIIGLPGDTETDVMATLAFLVNEQPEEIQLYGLTPHDGTALFGDLSSYGVRLIESDRSRWSRNVLKPVCETDKLPAERIIALAIRFVNELTSLGYHYITDDMPIKKMGFGKTVATAFSPVQTIRSIQ